MNDWSRHHRPDEMTQICRQSKFAAKMAVDDFRRQSGHSRRGPVLRLVYISLHCKEKENALVLQKYLSEESVRCRMVEVAHCMILSK